jgi:hypothetical protein
MSESSGASRSRYSITLLGSDLKKIIIINITVANEAKELKFDVSYILLFLLHSTIYQHPI